jgi:hypothetical protein
MEQKKIYKIGALVGFIILMLYSNWATVESLHMKFPEFPKLVFWPLSIIFFVCASLGTAKILESLDRDRRVTGRVGKLILGIVVTLFFWIIFIISTNTHTFFYERVIKNETIQELTNIKNNMEMLSSQGQGIIQDDEINLKRQFEDLLLNYKMEVTQLNDPSHGPKAESILIEIERLLTCHIQRLRAPSKRNTATLGQFTTDMESLMRGLLEIKLKEFKNKSENMANTNHMKDINKCKNDLIIELNKMNTRTKPNDTTKKVLTESLDLIKKYAPIKLKGYSINKKTIQESDITPKIIDLEDVFAVWRNFFNGNYANKGFTFMILMSMLIDVAGFLFFAYAFKKED